MHRLDARSKIFLLLAYSVGLLMCTDMGGLTLFAIILLVVLMVSKLPVSRVLLVGVPIYVIVFVAFFGNALAFGESVYGAVGIFPLVGNLYLSFDGCLRGAFSALRILLLFWAGIIFCFSTTSEEISQATASLLHPLKHIHIPVDDVAMVASLAVRFIPLLTLEFAQIKDAAWSRGRAFDEGPLFSRVRSYAFLFVPVMVALFQRAETLSCAMESRLYGLSSCPRTNLFARHMNGRALAISLIGCIVFLCIGCIF